MKGRVVFSTGAGRVCPRCGWPASECHCSSALATSTAPVPEKITARLRIQNRAAGKTVTILDGLPDNSSFLDDLATELKRRCGTGGAAGEGKVELQGDQRERLRELLAQKGWRVKG